MTAVHRPATVATDVLLRQIVHHLASLRLASHSLPAQRPRGHGLAARPIDLALAERIAASLRRLVIDTAESSAAVRARVRVRVAVHYFVVRRDNADDRRSDGLLDDLRVVNQIFEELGRDDLVVSPPD
ncbi:MAG: hypothetical protein GEU94_20330 [Micromonosporaceae bacterium]|nr:hypothetical protein [Micromonosporaceae bacterium]